MRVVVPYVEGMLDERTTGGLRLANIDARAAAAITMHTEPIYADRPPPDSVVTWHRLDAADDNAYHALLSELWDAGEDFVLVEHDIEIHADVIPTFESCPEPWCVYPYPGRPYKHYPVPILRCALGCTRFRAEFLKTNAGVLEAMLPGPSGSLRNPKHWRRCDSLLASCLHRRGFLAHEHEPHVIHHHDYANDKSYPGWIPPPGAAPRQ